MFKTFKAKYQAWLDGTPMPMFEAAESKRQPRPASVAGRPNPYAGLAKVAQPVRPAVRQEQRAEPVDAAPVGATPLATPKQRAYEAGLPEWAREALAEMDRVVGAAIHEALDEVRTPQYVRRHRRSLLETLEDGLTMDVDTDPDELVNRMMERARRASAPEITGVIPVVPVHEVTEEAWA